MKIVDLHAHTTASDGSYTPTELVRYAKKKGLSAIAITDHDTVAGVEEASIDDCDVHMTSLFINCKNEQLIKRLDDMAASRQERNYKMVDKLHEAGFQIDRSDLDALGEGKILARGHIAQILIARGYATELKEALRKYLSKGTPGYVQKEVLSPEECIQLVHDAGGLIFVAHLHQIDPQDPEHCKDVARRLIRMGADGLETQYCEFDDEWREATEQIAQECGCLRSGGSDFHGTMKKGLDLACGYGDLQVPYAFLEAMDAELARKQNERQVI